MLTGSVNQPHGMPDLSNCEHEPIHIPGSIQPHGVLLVLAEPDLTVLHGSANIGEHLGVPIVAALGQPLGRVIDSQVAQELQHELVAASARHRPVFLRTLTTDVSGAERRYHAVAHRTAAGIVLEMEVAAPDGASAPELATATNLATASTADAASPFRLDALVDSYTFEIESAETIGQLSQIACETIRRLTGFDRVLIYRFDEGWNGRVIGEDGSGRLPSYMHHRFPASDIPAQARELYRINRLRIIPDARYRPVPVTPATSPITGEALDLTFSTLRSVSPVHVEYMKNMGTASSMSISILRNGQLWGLISCHHAEPKAVPFPVRETCDLLARSFSLRLSAVEHSKDYERRIEVRSAYSSLLSAMADRGDFAAALAEHPRDLLSFAGSPGAAVLTEGECLLLGSTPSEEQTRQLADWLFRTVPQDVYSTESLAGAFPDAEAYKDKASGLLAIAVSKLHPSYVMWFRPEVLQTIRWGGDPNKPVEGNGDQTQLHPRKSFATWRETVRDRSLPWNASELEGAAELRTAIVETVLRKAEELAELNAELTRSNKELEAFSYSVSHDLRAPLRHIVGYAEMLRESDGDGLSERASRCIGTIIESSEYAGRLVDKLLAYSRLGRAELQLSRVEMPLLVQEIIADVMQDAEGRRVTWDVAQLPTVTVDLMMIRMAVRDLLSNAVKYTRERDEAVIEIGSHSEGDAHVFWVKDNGVGFDMEYADKLFGVFQRLHRWEDYEGTGIGLANVRRIVERHGGRTWAQGKEGQGAAFFFTLPKLTE